VARGVDWSRPWDGFVGALDRAVPLLAPAVRMMFEMLAMDAQARARGVTLAEMLGGAAPETVATNQTLFRSDDATLLHRADGYVARGFRDLKLRVGFGAFAEDLRRLELLRARYGADLLISADANGQWSAAEAPAYLRACAALGLRYVEQPLAKEAWDEVASLSAISAVPIMLDESLADLASIDRLVATRAAPLAHLKLAKLGGVDRLMAAGRRLRDAGIGFMVGQMNEGAVSTLGAAHAAAALGATMHELYGADGLVGDPAGALAYVDGALRLPAGPGLGLAHHAVDGTILWEHTA
jgi:L-alanine-DL-glutamate epimerase-like enolase superfamily enzyme